MKEGVSVQNIIDKVDKVEELEKDLSSVISAMNAVLPADIRKQIDSAVSCSVYHILNQALGEIQSCKYLLQNIVRNTKVDMGILNDYIL